MTENPIFTQIEETITKNDVVLYMKGTEQFPMCGFSGTVVQVLKNLGVNFVSVDVMQAPEIREGIKAFTQWPTIPQLYIKGEFVGGCDIVREMYENGELETLLKDKKII